MAAATVCGEQSSLTSQCLAFCQALASQGKAFSFSLKIDSTFSFSLDTREHILPVQTARKKISPSTQRRNAKRRQEFLNKKQSPLSPSPTKPSTSTSSLSTPTRSSSFSSSSEAEKQQLEKPQTEKVFRCAYKRCNATFASREEQVNHGKDTAKIPWGVVKSMHSGPMRDAQEQGPD